MKHTAKLFYYLGSVYFAITLIALTAVFVAAGTFLEAQTGSHLFSSNFTYGNPLFRAFIWGFFINILFSALRRWPFKTKHIPFLTTHLGLLMLLGGVIIKSYYGIQGSMGLMEGGSSNRLFIPNTYVIHIEKKDPNNPLEKIQVDYPLNKVAKQTLKFDDVEMRIADYSHHSHERFQTWIKGNLAHIAGLRKVKVINFDDRNTSSPKQTTTRFHHDNSSIWKVMAYRTNNVQEDSKQLYVEGTSVKISDLQSGKLLKEIPLIEALKEPMKVSDHLLTFALSWQFSPITGLENAELSVTIDNDKMSIALQGSDSLINRNISKPYIGKLPLAIDLTRNPVLILLQDERQDDYLFSYNSHGEIHSKLFSPQTLQSIVVYDNGFGGYAVQAPLGFGDFPAGRHEKEQAELLRLALELRQNLDQKTRLAPPLALIKAASDKTHQDFTESFLTFLYNWDKNSSILHTNSVEQQTLINHIDWNKLSLKEQYACGWLCTLLEDMEKELQTGKSFHQILIEREWPFAKQFAEFKPNQTHQMLSLFSQQLFAAADQLPPPDVMPSAIPTKALSAYLLALGVNLNTIHQPADSHQTVRIYHSARIFNDRIRTILSPLDPQQLALVIEHLPPDSKLLPEVKQAYINFQKQAGMSPVNHHPTTKEIAEMVIQYSPLGHKTLTKEESETLNSHLNAKEVMLETALTLNQRKMPALLKWEDNHPLVTLELTKGNKKEHITLTYDNYGSGLAWPILDGQYLIRYQPLFVEIPYRVRLHEGRQINYPGSQQSYSYEGEIIVTDLKNNNRQEKTISMNNVYETNDGYRFYLSSLSSSDESAPKRVQIVVNHDPAKYFLTYPGALIMCLGIILLFWMRPYSKVK